VPGDRRTDLLRPDVHRFVPGDGDERALPAEHRRRQPFGTRRPRSPAQPLPAQEGGVRQIPIRLQGHGRPVEHALHRAGIRAVVGTRGRFSAHIGH